MFDFFKHLTSKTRIILIGFVLILIPVVVISYIGLRSVNSKAESLKTQYSGTVSLVRDKLENEILQAETNLKNSTIDLFPESNNVSDLKSWLGDLEKQNPVFKNLFFVNQNNGLIFSSISYEWDKNQETTFSYTQAENAEFMGNDYNKAIQLYRNALNQAASAQEQAVILSRIGRCYFKAGNFAAGIAEYKKILAIENSGRIGSVPAKVVALSQIADSYTALNNNKEKNETFFQLYKYLIENPWDLYGGNYLYYLESAIEKISEIAEVSTEWNIEELREREKILRDQIRSVEVVNRNILPDLNSESKDVEPSEVQFYHNTVDDSISIIELGFFKLPAVLWQSDLVIMGFQFDKDYVLTTLFPQSLSAVETGKNEFIGILDGSNLLYLQQNLVVQDYLAAENFSQFFDDWKVALFDKDGRTIEQLVGKEKVLYIFLFIGIFLVMLIGVIVTIRAVIHETEMARLKSDFVSNVSHELKTPLALIRMFGETLDTGIVKDEKKKKEFYGIIRTESERLTHLINNVLDFSKMDLGIKKYNFIEADLVKVVKNSVEAYNFHIRKNGFEIEGKFPNKPIISKIDKDSISQAILNLLSNAVKYSDKTKYIKVQVQKEESYAVISVTDKGIGILKNELKKIFEKFYRVHNENVQESKGTGLGLTLTKQIVEAHGGTIEVKSEVDKGSTFIIRLPYVTL